MTLKRICIPPLRLHPAQIAIEKSTARFKVVNCGRRFGKTLSGTEWLLFGHGGSVVDGWPVGYFAPTYKLLLDVWAHANKTLKPIIRSSNKTDFRIEAITGGVMEFWTLDDEDAGRGRKYKRVLLDEAAHARKLKGAWEKSILPTLTDYKGEARVISTPNGLNYFKTLFGLADSESDWASFRFPTVSNPHIDPLEVERMRRLLPERVFAQEYLAEFLDTGGGVFRFVTRAIDHDLDDAKLPHRRWLDDPALRTNAYIIGVDWGRHNDFTVFAVYDATTKKIVYVDRFTEIDYATQIYRLKALRARLPNTAAVIAESNNMGGPLIEQIRRDGVPITSFHTSNASKAEAIEALAVAFEQGEISIPPVGWLVEELMAFEQKRLPGGAMRYSAPDGMHDDGVMAMAIALNGERVRPRVQGLTVKGL